ncbi:MAG: hypothetical protein K9N55_14300 [Phycisphaerae bacterium]|nr:hypothetical protein [Phycisphaerae bacterium]
MKLKFDLADIVPRGQWAQFSHVIIAHGRALCTARKPDCSQCPIGRCPALKQPSLIERI